MVASIPWGAPLDYIIGDVKVIRGLYKLANLSEAIKPSKE